MTTFEFEQVREFAADLNAKLDRCENGEGSQCQTVDSALVFCADCCKTFIERLKQWAREVFAGRVAFDPAAEQLWKAELTRLYSRSEKLLAAGRLAEKECFELSGCQRLQSALWEMNRFLTLWVTPKLATGPAARAKPPVNLDWVDEAKRTIASLQPLANDWMPDNQQQLIRYRWLKNSRR